ncbi:E3 ubiquitin-protein ligase-like protein [Drosera capensis]
MILQVRGRWSSQAREGEGTGTLEVKTELGLSQWYASLFPRGDGQALPSTTQGAAAVTSTVSTDNSLSDMYRSPPRPLPYDVDLRYFRLQRDGLVSRREKGSSHSHEETEPLRRSDIDADMESLTTAEKWNTTGEDGLKEIRKSSMKLSSRKSAAEFAYVCSSSEDEDVCPTCLEEYTRENPKIMTKCSHHFHLGCIYEWMERSENCPVCGKYHSSLNLYYPPNRTHPNLIFHRPHKHPEHRSSSSLYRRPRTPASPLLSQTRLAAHLLTPPRRSLPSEDDDVAAILPRSSTVPNEKSNGVFQRAQANSDDAEAAFRLLNIMCEHNIPHRTTDAITH